MAVAWDDLLLGMAGGLALFLYGVKLISSSVKALAGASFREALARLTANRFFGFLLGLVFTGIAQSLTLVSVLLISLVSASAIAFPPCLAVILGSNIGSTVIGHAVAFKLTKYGRAIFALGFLLWKPKGSLDIRARGEMLMALGLVFIGIEMMSAAVAPLKDHAPFLEALASLDDPVLGVAASAIFTFVIQSSSAAMGIFIMLANNQTLGLAAGCCLTVGANIGTVGSSALAAIGQGLDAQRLVVAMLLFRIIGTVLILPLMGPFVETMRQSSPESNGQAIANAHSAFNIVIAVLFLPWTETVGASIEKALPGETEKNKGNKEKKKV